MMRFKTLVEDKYAHDSTSVTGNRIDTKDFRPIRLHLWEFHLQEYALKRNRYLWMKSWQNSHMIPKHCMEKTEALTCVY